MGRSYIYDLARLVALVQDSVVVWCFSLRSSKLNEELPNVGRFQYCVSTPTQMKLTLTGCLFLRETNHFSTPVKIPYFAVNGVFPVTG